MKVTILINSLKGGGAERVASNLANYLLSKGLLVTFLTFLDSQTDYYINEKVCVKTLLSKQQSFYKINLRVRLIEYLKEDDSDCYIVLLPLSSILLLSCKRYTKAPVIVAERNSPSQYSRTIQLCLKLLSHNADYYIFQTESEKNWYKSYIPKVNYSIIPNAINEQFLHSSFPDKRTKTIVSVGRLVPQKNIPLLLKAFSLIIEEFPDYRLSIFGEGSQRKQCENYCKELGIDDAVVFEGHVNNIEDAIGNASLYILASDYEGMPNSLIEAMALGLPCIATDCIGGGSRALIQNGVNGFLVNRNNPEALANAMKKVLSNKELADKLGINARRITERLDPNTIYDIWLNVVYEVTKGKG